MVAVGHPAQRRQRLALGAGRDDHELLVGELVDLARLDEHALGHVDVPERAADVDVLAHRAADQRDLAVVAAAASTTCWTRWMFDAKQVTTIRPGQCENTRSRCGPTTDSLVEMPGAVGVRGVAAQQQQALAAQLGEPRHVGGRAADRRLVELVVAGEEDRAELGT